MLDKTGSMPMPPGTSVHHLRGKALRQWWQISSGKVREMSRNDQLRQYVVFLVCMPFFAVGSYYVGGPKVMTAIWLSVLVWLGIFVLLLSSVRRHLYRVLEVRVSEDGLELRSLFFTRKIRWLEIVDFFSTGNLETGHNDFALECSTGEQFFLSKDLTDSNQLFATISRCMSRPGIAYDITYDIGDGLIDGAIGASFAVMVALLFGPSRWLLTTSHPGINDVVTNLVIPVLLTGLPLFCWWLHVTKVPRLVRAGTSGLYIKTRSGTRVIGWDQITSIKRIIGWMVIRSRSGWFVMYAPKKEPMTEKLLECQRNLLALTRTRS